MAGLGVWLAALALLATSASALDTGNLAYLSPVIQLQQLAKTEPLDMLAVLSHARKLLQSAWNPKPAAGSIFAQASGSLDDATGVASGDPYATSVILWTRVTPTAAQKGKPAALEWAVATDRGFNNIKARGATTTNGAVDYTAKVEAGGLSPNTRYVYQWRYTAPGGAAQYSQIGRTRTIPRATDALARARIAYFSCASLAAGYFTSYGQIARMANNGTVDYLIHLGDYIYEAGFAARGPLPASRNHQPRRETVSLADYRTRYNQYNSDADLKGMRAAAPLIPVWDDHEYANDAYRDGAQNHQPATEGDWDARRLRALQVYYEQMPIRQVSADNKQRIYRDFEIGNLIKLVMLDTRIIGRDKQNGAARNDPKRSILGDAQETYLKKQLTAAKGKQTWKVIGQQVVFAHLCNGQSADSWDGYRADQRAVLNHITSKNINNVVILTGDIHRHRANDIPKFPCPKEAGYNYNPSTGKGSVAVEFVSSSITSAYDPSDSNKAAAAKSEAAVKAANPHIKYEEDFYKGFAVLDVTKAKATSTWYFAPQLYQEGQYSNMVKGQSWTVRAGTNHLVRGTK